MNLLFEYTKFHIGIYLTLAAAFITLGTSKFSGKLPKFKPGLVWAAVISIAIAGFAGGVVASSITQSPSTSVPEFLKQPTGPWSMTWWTGQTWTCIEHTAFWIGIIFVLLSFKFRTWTDTEEAIKAAHSDVQR
jgi:hypothetical protein